MIKLKKILKEGNWKAAVEGIEISADGLSITDFAKAVAGAVKTSYGHAHAKKFLSTLKKYIK